MPYKEVDSGNLKVYYPIGEVAEMLDVSVSLLRYWENEFEVLKPIRNKKGNRFFTKKDVDLLKKIHLLVKVQGHTLEGAKRSLEEENSTVQKKTDLILRLENLKLELERIRALIK